MKIRKAFKTDWAGVRRFAARFDLDYEDMEADDFWVAAQGSRIAGICGLATHPDCLELRSLAVADRFRKRGVGRMLVSTLCDQADGDIFITTIIPDYFVKLGFEPATAVPASMVKPEAWCGSCRRGLCRVMVKRR
jgi:N-acetylglutamate synthase-like GNAT family acetyltransferase